MSDNYLNSKILNALISQMSAGFIWIEKSSGAIKLFNKAAVEILGPTVTHGQNCFKLDGSPFKKEDYPSYRATFLQEHVKSEEMLYQGEKAQPSFLSVSATPVYDDDQLQIGVVCIIQDITEKKELELDLIKAYDAEKKAHSLSNKTLADFEMLYESSTVGVALFDLQYRYVKLNHVLGDFNGIPLQDHIGKTVHELFGELGYDLEKKIQTVIDTKLPIPNFEVVTATPAHPEELRAYLVSFYPLIKNGAIAGVGMFATDISINKRNEEALKEALIELEKERASVHQFVSTLTHDIQNPLMAIKLNASLISHSVGNQKKLLSINTKIQSSIDKTSKLISDVLDINRIQAGKKINLVLSEVNLSNEIALVIEEFVSIDGARFEVDVEDDLIGIWSQMDVNRLLTNLISNALKYGNKDCQINIQAGIKADSVIVSINNKGPVIPIEERESIFKAFSRGSLTEDTHQKKSWGLGLAISKGIIDAHHGFINCNSDQEAGTTFTFQLPLNSNLKTKKLI